MSVVGMYFCIALIFTMSTGDEKLKKTPTIQILPWGENSLRVRITMDGSPIRTNLPTAITEELHNLSHLPKINHLKEYVISNGNIKATVSTIETGQLITISRLSDGKVLLREISRTLEKCDPQQSTVCDNKTTVIFSSNPNQLLTGTGQHMNTHGISDRLPPRDLFPGQMLPSTNMKSGRWDFESCTVYTDSSGAEICLPWIIAASPPELSKPCPSHANTDQNGAIHVGDQNGLHATERGCCTRCKLIDRCELWIHQPSLNKCWLMMSNTSSGVNVTTKNAPDRTLGWKKEAPDCGVTSASYDYGLLWNMPNFGEMDLQNNSTIFTAYDTINTQIDWFVTTYGNTSKAASHGADILKQYVDAVGHAPIMPDWAAGYWHSPMGNNRYSQKDVIDAVNGFVQRDLQLPSLFVIDYFNWKNMGDYTFNPAIFPKPNEMVQMLNKLGIRMMVSAWPYVGIDSRSSPELQNKGYAVHYSNGSAVYWPDSVCSQDCYLYDPTNPDARKFLANQLHSGYGSFGIHNYWLDASEPESLANAHFKWRKFNNPHGQPDGTLYHIGSIQQVGMMFPWWHSKTVYDGVLDKNPNEVPVNLVRCGWVGSWRWGASNWNGDLQASWTNLKKSIVAGVNAQLSGIAWWTHDIGAIGNCDISKPEYRELLIRWFQFGLTSPIFRQHGSRPVEPWDLLPFSGNPSGNETYNAVINTINLRYKLKPYVLQLMIAINATGVPVNRPLSYDFPDDPTSWYITDQIMFGPKYMAAFITDLGSRSRIVYFPTSKRCAGGWKHYFTGKIYKNGEFSTVSAPLDEFPFFECVSSIV